MRMSQRSGVEQRLKQVVAAHPGLRQVAKWTRNFVGATPNAAAHAARDAQRQRTLLTDPFFASQLQSIDEELGRNPQADITKLFANVSLDVFALLLFDRPSAYPNLCRYFPQMPSEERQKEWVGNAGLPLALESSAFVRSLVEKRAKHVQTPLPECNVLDYGFGWGRVLRVLQKFVPEQRLYGFDPWASIVDEARALGVRGTLEVVPEYPTELPGPKFNLIYAFSIFTHLSERCHLAVLNAFHGSLADDGIAIITVRPSNYWQYKKHARAAELTARHEQTGFAFDPHPKLTPAPDGEVPYGDATISAKYVAERWQQFELLEVDVNALQPEQILLVLRKRSS
jgi:hypothetical protein